MVGDGRQVPRVAASVYNFTCRAALLRRRTLPKLSKFDNSAGVHTAAEISLLEQQVARIMTELQQTKAKFTHKMEVHVWAGVRKARVETDAAVFEVELSKLKEASLAFAHLDYRRATHHSTLLVRVARLNGKMRKRDAEIRRLNDCILAYEENNTLGSQAEAAYRP
eukprot:6207923-Pleurochrysis_carterae.AAC.1